MEFNGKDYPVGYKVVTPERCSLGLRKNPNILRFPIGEWYSLPESEVEEGVKDWGGIWVARTLSSARGLQRYMKKQHAQETRVFKTLLDKILFANSYRVKTNGINMIEEVR